MPLTAGQVAEIQGKRDLNNHNFSWQAVLIGAQLKDAGHGPDGLFQTQAAVDRYSAFHRAATQLITIICPACG